MKRKWLLAAGAAAVIVVAALGVGAVMAQSEEDGEGRTFLDRVAEKLGIEAGRLEQAIRDAKSDQIEEALAEGDITEEQAQRLRERIEEFDFDGGRPFGFGFKFGGGDGIAGCARGLVLGGVLPFADGRLAEFLGMTPEELRDALREDGATLAKVAEANGATRDELKAFLLGGVRERLDEAVAEGDITQEQADRCLERFDAGVERLMDAELRLPFDRGRGPGPGMRWHLREHHGFFEQGEDGGDEGAAPQRGRVPALSES